ncbi:hypothetical protein M3Y95_01241000 [Aphelenchoides besseyi]|nr:hypothetical protein M3Y95_01241000 [Aphelenchoides besseyi]
MNENVRLCLLKHEQLAERSVRLLLVSRRFLNLLYGADNSIHLQVGFNGFQLNKSFNFSVTQICFLFKLLGPNRVYLQCRFFPRHRPLTFDDFRNVQIVCNELGKVNELKVGMASRPQIQQLLLDQLPKRIAEISCRPRDCLMLSDREIGLLIVRRDYGEHEDFNHLFRVNARKILFPYLAYCNLSNTGPLKQNESIEEVQIDIRDAFIYNQWIANYITYFSTIFTNLRTINNKLTVRLSLPLRSHEKKFEQFFCIVHSLIDCAKDAHLLVSRFVIHINGHHPNFLEFLNRTKRSTGESLFYKNTEIEVRSDHSID